MSGVLVTAWREFNEPRLIYIVVKYEYLTGFVYTVNVITGALYHCFVGYVNSYPRVVHTFYITSVYLERISRLSRLGQHI